jgi:sec-independent protein translocase protein TatA
LIIVLFIVVMIFGVGKLPQVGGAVGKAIKEFRRSQAGEGDDPSATALASSKRDGEEGPV